MALKLFNTLGREKQEFVPLKKGFLWMRPEVRMYSCGPTVYNFAHIGNLRAYVFADVLKRTLRYNGYRVKHIINVTDIGHLTSDADQGDDKMVKAIQREGLPMTLESLRIVGQKYFKLFIEDIAKLNILGADSYPFASDHIGEDVKMIQTLIDKGYAYKTQYGIYFDTSKLVDYGKLGGIEKDGVSRIESYGDKHNSQDFALWKLDDLGFDTPLGKGFPGWHIECSVMSEKYLGVPFDIHTGGIDHIPVHHNNEIAQTEAATGKMLSNYWVHSNHVTISGEKMSKSAGNFFDLNLLEKEGVSPLAYRYWLLTARYSTRMDYSLEAVKAAQTAYDRLIRSIVNVLDIGVVSKEYKKKFLEAVNDDLDTPKALALVWEVLKDEKLANADKRATLLDFDKVLGLGLADVKGIQISKELQALLDERQNARDAKDWPKADELRMAINKLGFEVKDTPSGQELTKL